MARIYRLHIFFMLIFSTLCLSRVVNAEDTENVEFTGTLITPPPCVIEQDNTVQVKFGDKIGIRKIPAGVYRQPVPLNLQCDENTQSWQLVFSVTGNSADFDADNATVVTFQQAALGVKIYLDGQPFELGKKVKVNWDALPSIEAVLVQRDGETLVEGDFTALATVRAEYQ